MCVSIVNYSLSYGVEADMGFYLLEGPISHEGEARVGYGDPRANKIPYPPKPHWIIFISYDFPDNAGLQVIYDTNYKKGEQSEHLGIFAPTLFQTQCKMHLNV